MAWSPKLGQPMCLHKPHAVSATRGNTRRTTASNVVRKVVEFRACPSREQRAPASVGSSWIPGQDYGGEEGGAGTLTGILPRTHAQQSSRSPSSALCAASSGRACTEQALSEGAEAQEKTPPRLPRGRVLLEASPYKRKTQLAATRREFPSTPVKTQSSTWGRYRDKIYTFRF